MEPSIYGPGKDSYSHGAGSAEFIPSLKQLLKRRYGCFYSRSQDPVATGLCDSVSGYVLSFVGMGKIGDLCLASSVHSIKYITIGRWLAASAERR